MGVRLGGQLVTGQACPHLALLETGQPRQFGPCVPRLGLRPKTAWQRHLWPGGANSRFWSRGFSCSFFPGVVLWDRWARLEGEGSCVWVGRRVPGGPPWSPFLAESQPCSHWTARPSAMACQPQSCSRPLWLLRPEPRRRWLQEASLCHLFASDLLARGQDRPAGASWPARGRLRFFLGTPFAHVCLRRLLALGQVVLPSGLCAGRFPGSPGPKSVGVQEDGEKGFLETVWVGGPGGGGPSLCTSSGPPALLCPDPNAGLKGPGVSGKLHSAPRAQLQLLGPPPTAACPAPWMRL